MRTFPKKLLAASKTVAMKRTALVNLRIIGMIHKCDIRKVVTILQGGGALATPKSDHAINGPPLS